MLDLPVVLVFPLLNCVANEFIKMVIGSSSLMALTKLDEEVLRDAANKFGNTLHEILKPAFENVQDHVTKAARADFKACFDKLRNGLVYLDNDFLDTSTVTSLSPRDHTSRDSSSPNNQSLSPKSQTSSMGAAASSVKAKLSRLDPSEAENACRWFRKAHSAALTLCHNSQLDLAHRLEAMAVVLFCSAFEHVEHPNRAIKVWKSQLSQFLDDSEIRNVLENPSNAKNRQLLDSVRQMCTQIYEAARKISAIDAAAVNETMIDDVEITKQLTEFSFESKEVSKYRHASSRFGVPTYDIFMLECIGSDHEDAYLSIVNTGYNLGSFGGDGQESSNQSSSPLTIKVFDAERIFVSNDGRLIVMKRQSEIQWILYDETGTTTISITTLKHSEPVMNAVGAILTEDRVPIFILDQTGKLYQTEVFGSNQLVPVKAPPLGTGNADIAISANNKLLMTILHDKTLFIAVTSTETPSNDWKILFDYPDSWAGGDANIRMDAKYHGVTMETSLMVYGKGSRFLESRVFFAVIDSENALKSSFTKTIKIGFGSRKQRMACCFGPIPDVVFSVTKEKPNSKGNATTIQKFDLNNLDKSEEKMVVKPLMTTLKDIAVSQKTINLAFYV